MIFGLHLLPNHRLRSFTLKAPPFLLVLLVVFSILACNPFAKGGDESATNSEQVLPVSNDRPTSGSSNDNQQADSQQPGQPPAENSQATVENSTSQPTPEPTPAESSEATSESPPENTVASSSSETDAEKAVDLVWAFLSQCVSLSVNELEARQVDGQWYVQAVGDKPDLYGVWKVDPAYGSVEAHDIRARQWAPEINSQCTQESFAQFYIPTPAPQLSDGITEAGQATTSLWATLVKCYPTIQTEDLQATLNPARAEWIVTGKPEVTTNYGVWAVRSNGEVVPNNRQAQGIYEQLDSGLC